MEKVITIDGPAGSGKSTVSKALAVRLHYTYLDTGALYRALAYKALKNGIALTDRQALSQMCRNTDVELKNINGALSIFVDGENVSDKIRLEEVGLAASRISAFPEVRERLLALQRDAGKLGGIVAEGRDMGSVVFPNADHKFFLQADSEERIRRRHQELLGTNRVVKRETIARDMQTRDVQDSQRDIAPLMASPDALMIDSTDLTIDQVVEEMLQCILKSAD